MARERIQKVISQSGVLSRRKAEDALRLGRISVNGEIVRELGTTVDADQDVIALDGKPITRLDQRRVVIFYKPRGVITSLEDPEGRPTVAEYFPPEWHLRPAGRLDFHSEGLLIMTNDGELHQRLTHPRFNIQKTYLARVNRTPDPAMLASLVKGLALEDGEGRFISARISGKRVSDRGVEQALVEVVVGEGRNRFIRRMFEAVGLEVRRLRRTAIGALNLGELKPGEFRVLGPLEIKALEGA